MQWKLVRCSRAIAALYLLIVFLLTGIGQAAPAGAENASISASLNATEFPVDRASRTP